MSGTLDLSGAFSNCAGACSVEVSFGALPSQLTVQKTVSGLTPPAAWQFAGPKGNFSLPAIGGTTVITPLGSAAYAITETTKPGFVASTSCTNGASGGNNVSFTPDAGATITCTFSNVITPTYTTITVTPVQPQGWSLIAELSGSNVITPAALDIQSPPPAAMLGTGSAVLALTETAVGKLFYAPILTGARLSDLLVLTYSTHLAGGEVPAIQIGWDDDSSDANTGWRDRLVFVPNATAGAWQTWNALSDTDGVWFTIWGGLPDNSCRLNLTSGCTWSQILSKFPNAVIHPTSPLGFVGVKAGSGGTGTSYFDALTIAANQNIVTYNFDPEIPCTTVCYADAVTGNDLNGGGAINNAKKTIQAAIDAVQPNGTVLVKAGAYTELVTVNKAVTLKGAQSGFSGAGRCDASAGETVMNDPKGAFYITADGVTIDGFVIQSATNTAWMGTGVYIAGNTSGHTLRNNVFRDSIFGLYLNSSGAQPTLVENNCFKNNNEPGAAGGNGIYADQGTNDVTVRSNYFTGHQNAAMLVTKYGSYTVNNVTILSNTMENDNRIYLDQSSNVSISGNVFTSTLYHGVQLAGGNSNITITNNTVQGAGYAGVRVSNGSGAGPNTNIAVLSNTLTGGQYGVWVGSDGLPATTAVVLDMRFNILSSNTYGVVNEANALASLVNRNDLSNSTTKTISNTHAGLLNGECNWFGNLAGPGATIAGNVDSIPWLTDSDLHSACALATLNVTKVVNGTAPASGEFDQRLTFYGYPVTSYTNFTLKAGDTKVFTDMLPGNYALYESQSLGYASSISCAGGPAINPSGFQPQNGNGNGSFSLVSGGLVTCTVTNTGPHDVSGLVINDFVTPNGVLDAGELPLPNVTVTLTGILGGCLNPAALDPQTVCAPAGAIQLTATTNLSGEYHFAGLPNGSFRITVLSNTLPAGLATPTADPDGIATPHTAGIDLCEWYYSQDALTTPNASPTVVRNCLEDSVDFGYRGEGFIGDHVFFDVNGDGAQDAGDLPLAGVMLTLNGDLNSDGATDTLTDTTDNNGGYGFENLPQGTFTVTVVTNTLPAGVSPVAGAGSIGANESTLTLAASEIRSNADFGYTGNLSVGDSVFYDLNNNSVQDAGDLPLPNVTLNLSGDMNNDNVAEVLTATTNAAGIYYFSGVPSGVFTITVNAPTLPAGMTPTFDLDGIATPHQAIITLGNAPRFDVDFGYRGTGSTGDLVWEDSNANGSYDAGEPGLNAALTLVGDLNNDGIEDTINSNAVAGAYTFANLIPGTFTLTANAASLPANMLPIAGAGSVGGFNAIVALGNGEARANVDFGFVRPGVIHGREWLDVNRNGQQDAGEPGLPDVTIKLFTVPQTMNAQAVESTGPVSTTTSGANGAYSFSGIVPGQSYTMNFSLPNGTSWTTPHAGNPNTDSDVDADGNTGVFTLPSGADVSLNISAGATKPTQIAITKTAQPGTVRLGENITYTLVARNAGETMAQNVVITDGLPAEVTFVSASPMPSMMTPALTWAVGDLMPGQSFTITLIGNVKKDAVITAGIRNTAFVNAAQQSIVESDMMQSSAFVPLQPTAITLASFNAALENNGVRLAWRTSLEQNTFGFNVLRSASGNRNDAVHVNAELIPAKNDAGSTYALVDAQGSVSSVYWLQEMDLSGATTDFGPFRVSAPAIVAQPIQQPAPQQSAVNAVVAPAGVPVGGVPVAGVSMNSAEAVVGVRPADVQSPQPAIMAAQPAAQPMQDVPAQPATVAPMAAPVEAKPIEVAPAQPAQVVMAQGVVAEPAMPGDAQPVQPSAQPAATQSEVAGMTGAVGVARGGNAVEPAITHKGNRKAAAAPNSAWPIAAAAGVMALLAGVGVLALRRRRK